MTLVLTIFQPCAVFAVVPGQYCVCGLDYSSSQLGLSFQCTQTIKFIIKLNNIWPLLHAHLCHVCLGDQNVRLCTYSVCKRISAPNISIDIAPKFQHWLGSCLQILLSCCIQTMKL